MNETVIAIVRFLAVFGIGAWLGVIVAYRSRSAALDWSAGEYVSAKVETRLWKEHCRLTLVVLARRDGQSETEAHSSADEAVAVFAECIETAACDICKDAED